jgi:capsular polysaccharide transport system permease protein
VAASAQSTPTPAELPAERTEQPSGKKNGSTAPAPDPAPAARERERAPAQGTTASFVKQLRRQQARRLLLRIALFVVLPTSLAGTYYGLIASNQFESYAHFTVNSAEMRPSFGLETLLGVTGAPATRDTLAVREYVMSRDMLAKLQKEHGFIDHYKHSGGDFLTRLAPDATFEEAYEYYKDKVRVDFDSTSGALTLRVRALSPSDAQSFSDAIIKHSEEMVNQLSQRERQDQTRYAEEDVKKSEQRLSKARQALLTQQQKHAELNPLQTATSAMTLRTQLEGELAKVRAELQEAKSYMAPTAPRVLALTERARSISAQVSQEKRRLVDPKSENGIAGSMAEFEAAAVEKEFAQKSYESAMAALEVARAQAARQHRYLAKIASPSLPDESTYPRRLLSVFTVLVTSFLLLGIGSLLVAAVREHARI